MYRDLHSQLLGERRLHFSGSPLDHRVESRLQPADKDPLPCSGEALYYKLHTAGGRMKGKLPAYGYQEPLVTGSASATLPAKGDPSSSRSIVRRFVSAEEKTSAR